MNIKNYDDVTGRLQDYLTEYLMEKGGLESPEGKIRCLSPYHDDQNPSMSIAPSGRVIHCFSCGFSSNIFQACHVLENKPASGPEWVHENLKYLAEKYGVLIEMDELTEEELYELDTRRAYRAAAELVINGQPTAAFTKAIAQRGWTLELCYEMGIGWVSNFDRFKGQLVSLGFSEGFQKEIDLTRPDIFSDDRLIFTVRDEHGTPVGFSSRNLRYTGDKKDGAKYVNQRTTGIRVNIYQKSSRLYGLDRAIKKADKRSKAIYIFEGYSDVVTAATHGLNNCVALGGVNFSMEQVQLLKEHSYYDLILCLDGDEAGHKNVASILDERLAGHKDLRVRIITPPAGKDPDLFIRESTIAKFKDLKKHDAFEWRLKQFSDDADSEEVCKSMIPLIVNETSYVTQDKMCEQLAKNTGTPISVIRNELSRLQNQKEAEKARERGTIIDYMVKACQRDPTSAEHNIHVAESKLYELARRYDEDSFSEDTCFSMIQGFKEAEEAKDGSFSGFRLGEDLKALEDALCGEWRRDVWFCIGGKENVGKTSLMVKLIYQIAEHEDNNACVIYHTIDDTIQQILPKFVCVANGTRRLSLNQTMDPNYHRKPLDKMQAEGMLARREDGYNKVKKLVKAGRMIIKDANDGISLAYADRLIRYYRQKFPKRRIVYVLDNFHKLQDFASKDERVRFKTLSTAMKRLATKYHICAISTVEYRKTKEARAGNQDIAETGEIAYDGNLIAHLHNDMHEKGAQTPYLHKDTIYGEERKLPRIEFEIAKNKVNAFKESIWMDFWPNSSDFSCVSNEKVAADARSAKEDIENSKSDKRAFYFEIVEEICDTKGNWKKPMAQYKGEYGEWPSNQWQNEAKRMFIAAGVPMDS